MPAKWIAAARRADAEQCGYVVVEPTTVVATHLIEVLKANAAELLGRQDVQEMVEALKRSHPALVDEVVPNKISLGTLPPRAPAAAARARARSATWSRSSRRWATPAEATKDPEHLAEHARRALANVIARLFAGPDGAVRGITLGPRLEQALTGLFSPRPGSQPAGLALLTPDGLAGLLRDLNEQSTGQSLDGRPLPLIVPPSLRVGVRRLIEPVLPALPVVSLAELPAQVTLHAAGSWEMP
jgi:flagellar biosynthesis protein FlhA